jgi:serine/threonine-protein kinase HipA
MRALEIYRNDELAGWLTEEDNKNYKFEYAPAYLENDLKPAVSLTLPKQHQPYHSFVLFPFFFNMLSEGVNRKLQSRLLKIDENDHFGLLAATAQSDTIGAITVKLV